MHDHDNDDGDKDNGNDYDDGHDGLDGHDKDDDNPYLIAGKTLERNIGLLPSSLPRPPLC